MKTARWPHGPLSKLLGLALLSWLTLGVAFAVDVRHALHAYLAAYVWGIGIPLGALVFLAITNAMNATWPVAVRRVAEQIAATLPLFAVLFVPIFAGLASLFPWMTPEQFHEPNLYRLVLHRRAYYNAPFFVIRWMVVFATWTGLALLLRHYSLRQDADDGDGAELRRRMARLAVAGLIPLALTISVAAFDWLMSLTPTWYSTVFGIYFFAGAFVAGLAGLTLACALAQGRQLLPGLRPSHYHALGRLLLAFTAFWAYIAYFQFMLVWIANRPTEGAWFLPRGVASWRGVGMALVVVHFAVPFVLLLSYRLKRSRRLLGLVALWLIASHYVDAYWLVMPAFAPAGFRPSWIDGAALVAVASSLAAAVVALLRRRALVAMGDPVLGAALDYESP